MRPSRTSNRCSAPLLLLASLPLAWAPAEHAARQPVAEALTTSPPRGPDTEDEKLLAQAQEEVRKRHYKRAITIYKKLAKKFPETKAGAIGKERSLPTAFIGWDYEVQHGPSANRVDVLLMGDGFEGTDKDQRAFDSVAAMIPGWFEKQATLGEYYNYFNFLRVNLASKDDNYDNFGRKYDTALDAYMTDTDEGTVAVSAEAVRGYYPMIPEHDELTIALVRRGSQGQGHPGIAVACARSEKNAIHEWGHAFADLGDEYSRDTQQRTATRDRPNISANPEEELVPWKHFLDAKVSGVGVYEGADGKIRSAWKPTNHCLMSSGEIYCPVCQEAIVLAIYKLVDPIDSCTPAAHPLERGGEGPAPLIAEKTIDFQVHVLRPEKHDLQVRWYVLPEAEAPAGPQPIAGASGVADRRGRGPLQAIDAKPAAKTRGGKNGKHTFKFKASKYESGNWRIVCRVIDLTEIRGSRHPWVLKDVHGVLQSERAWWVTVE